MTPERLRNATEAIDETQVSVSEKFMYNLKPIKVPAIKLRTQLKIDTMFFIYEGVKYLQIEGDEKHICGVEYAALDANEFTKDPDEHPHNELVQKWQQDYEKKMAEYREKYGDADWSVAFTSSDNHIGFILCSTT